jgi:hypothetical protein
MIKKDFIFKMFEQLQILIFYRFTKIEAAKSLRYTGLLVSSKIDLTLMMRSLLLIGLSINAIIPICAALSFVINLL